MRFSEDTRINGNITNRRKIYVVDDECVIARTLCLILERLGYEASMFFSAESALEAVQSAAPDLVLSDIVMTGEMSGVELAEILAQTHPFTKVLLISGLGASSHTLRNAQDRGFFPAVRMKPIAPTLLLAEIANLIGGPVVNLSRRSSPLYVETYFELSAAAAAPQDGVVGSTTYCASQRHW